MESITETPIEVDSRGWHYACVETFQVYGNRYIGPEGAIYWNTSVAGEHGPVRHYWISEDGVHDVSTHLWINYSGRSQIVVHGIAENLTNDEKTALSKAIATWEKNLVEHERRTN
jgi:hypothetical protein